MSSPATDIVILKQNPAGELMYRWHARLIKQQPHQVLVEAGFNVKNGMLLDIPLQEGDRFLETYYDDRWFNIFEIRDKKTGVLKAWYCNVSAPAIIRPGEITFRDFALDLVVYPDGRQVVMDEDEFAALDCLPGEREQALAGLAQVQAQFRRKFEAAK